MDQGFLHFVLGAAFAAFGLSALRLARIDSPTCGWLRLCIAGLASALLQWQALYTAAYGTPQTNDLPGSLLALVSLLALAEFSRKAIVGRFLLGVWMQIVSGLVVASLAVTAFALANRSFASGFQVGIYPRMVFTLYSVGLTAAGLALAAMAAPGSPGCRWIRLAGLSLILGVLGSATLYAAGTSAGILAWPLVPAVAAAAMLLRAAYITRRSGSTRTFGRWAALEFAVLAAILVAGAVSAHHRGEQTIDLEKRQLIQTAEAAAAAFEPGYVGALSGTPADTQTAAHQAVSRRLLTIQRIARSTTSAEHGSRFAYLMAMREGRIVFLADQPPDPEQPTEPGDIYEEASPQLRRALADGQPFIEGPLADRYGNWVSAFAAIRNTDGKILAVLGIDFDASDWARIEEKAQLLSLFNWTLLTMIALSLFTSVGLGLEAQHQLRRSEHLFRTAADYTSTWEYWVGPDGRMVFTSLASEKLTGYPASRFEKHPRGLLKIVHPSDRVHVGEHLRACAHDAPACEFDFRIVRKDGKTAWIKHSCESVYDEHGRWSGRRASNRDITALRMAELALSRQERLQAGCHQALRRLLGKDGAKYLEEAVELAAHAGGCSCAAVFRFAADEALEALDIWPDDKAETPLATAWRSCHDRALPILSVGEGFELLPRETRTRPGPLCGTHIAMLPVIERGRLTGIAMFAAAADREPWSKAETAALATLASGLSVALANAHTHRAGGSAGRGREESPA